MYESIRGTLTQKEPAFVVVETAGIGWRIQVPLPTYEALPRVGAEVFLLLHLVLREDEWRLHGFADEDTRTAFRTLLRVSGVGPSVALAVLGTLGAAALRRALAEGDVRALLRVKGVGRKTAERILVELRGSLPEPVGGGARASRDAGPVEEAVRALESLGYAPDDARARVQSLLEPAAEGTAVQRLVPADADAAALVRAALRAGK